MTTTVDGKFCDPLLLILQEVKRVFPPKVMMNLQKILHHNLLLKCSKSRKTTKEITGEYLTKIKECIGNYNIILLLDRWSSQTDFDLCFSKLRCNVQPVYLPAETTPYLQPLDVYFFNDYKYFVKKLTEYSQTHSNICQSVDVRTREGIIQMHNLAFNQFCSPAFNEMRRYAFQKSLFRNNNPVFRSVKQIRFNVSNKMCTSCDKFAFIVCAWCWKVF